MQPPPHLGSQWSIHAAQPQSAASATALWTCRHTIHHAAWPASPAAAPACVSSSLTEQRSTCRSMVTTGWVQWRRPHRRRRFATRRVRRPASSAPRRHACSTPAPRGLPLTGGLSHRLDLSPYVPAEHNRGRDERDRDGAGRRRVRHRVPVRRGAAGDVEPQLRGRPDGAEPGDGRCRIARSSVLLRVCLHASARRSRRLLRVRWWRRLRTVTAGEDVRHTQRSVRRIAKVPGIGRSTSTYHLRRCQMHRRSCSTSPRPMSTDPGFVTVYPCGQPPPDCIEPQRVAQGKRCRTSSRSRCPS